MDAKNGDLIVGEDGLARPLWATKNAQLRDYYDTEWGIPVRSEQGLFERLSLEVFQAGLSWATILNKRENFRAAFAGFSPEAVALFDLEDETRLLQDAGIIRNGAKIRATINNAKATVRLRTQGGLASLIWSAQPKSTPRPQTLSEIPSSSAESAELAKKLKSHGFKFVGPVGMYALMEAIGVVDTHLVGSHRRGSSGLWSDS